MNTIIDVGGKQYNVKKGDIIAIDLVDKQENDKIEFDKVLMVKDGEKEAVFGTPYLNNAKVQAKVLKRIRADKVLVFKFKRRKNERRLRGHKQPYTLVQIENIVA